MPSAAKEAIVKGTVVSSAPDVNEDTGRSMAIPIKLRGQIIGVLNVKFRGGGASEDTEVLLGAAAERLAAALENSRLIAQSRQRAEREHAISEVSAKIGASIDVDAIMRSTVEELGRLLGDSEVSIQLRGNGTNHES